MSREKLIVALWHAGCVGDDAKNIVAQYDAAYADGFKDAQKNWATHFRAQTDDGGQDCETEQEARDWLQLPDPEFPDWEIKEVRTRQVDAGGTYRRVVSGEEDGVKR